MLHAWWPFDGNGDDYSGNERHGEFYGLSQFGVGRFDDALDLTKGGFSSFQEEKTQAFMKIRPVLYLYGSKPKLVEIS